MKTETMIITPQKAKAMLAKSGGNRTLSKETVAAYARDMSAGRWMYTHQGLLLGRNDTLIDGHHRLHAVAQSGTTQKFLVAKDEGLTSPKDLPLDVGNKRSLAYVLGSDSITVAVARFAMQLLDGRSVVTPHEVRRYLDKVAPAVDRLSNRARRGISVAPVVLGAAARILRGEDDDYIRETYYSLVNDKFTELPPYPASFYRQVVVERVAFTPDESFVRALRVFDYTKRDVPRLGLKNTDKVPFRETTAYVEALEYLRRALGE